MQDHLGDVESFQEEAREELQRVATQAELQETSPATHLAGLLARGEELGIMVPELDLLRVVSLWLWLTHFNLTVSALHMYEMLFVAGKTFCCLISHSAEKKVCTFTLIASSFECLKTWNMFGQSYNLSEEQSIMNLPVVWFEQQRELVHVQTKTDYQYIYTGLCSRMF